MNAQAQAVVMVLLGGAVVRATLTDMHLRYVKPELGPFLLGAGALLFAAGAMTLFYDLRRGRADTEAQDDDGDHEHEHEGHSAPRVGWLLLLPVLGLLLVAPPALGSYAAGQSGTALATQRLSEYAALPPGDPVDLTVVDYASRAVYDRGASLGDRRVRLTGFLMTGPDGTQYLTRIILSCCAADGRPIKVGLSGDAPVGRPADTWVRVVGRFTDRTAADPVNDEPIPYLEVETWEAVHPPKQQYE